MCGDVMQYRLVLRTQRSNSERGPIAQPAPQGRQVEGTDPVVKDTGLWYPGGSLLHNGHDCSLSFIDYRARGGDADHRSQRDPRVLPLCRCPAGACEKL
jgi:hypothetical protein